MKNKFCTWCHQWEGGNHQNSQNVWRCACCPQCGRAVSLIEIRVAAEIVNVSRKTIYDWIRKHRISAMRTSGGRQLICLSSLFDPRKRV